MFECEVLYSDVVGQKLDQKRVHREEKKSPVQVQ